MPRCQVDIDIITSYHDFTSTSLCRYSIIKLSYVRDGTPSFSLTSLESIGALEVSIVAKIADMERENSILLSFCLFFYPSKIEWEINVYFSKPLELYLG